MRLRLPLLVGLLVGVAAPPGYAGDDAASAAPLRALGLAQHGEHWLGAAELRLRKRLAGWDALEKRYHQADKLAAAALLENERLRARLVQLEAAAASGRRAAAAAPAPRPSADASSSAAKQPPKLSSKSPDLTGPGEQTPLQRAMIGLVQARIALLAAKDAAERDQAAMGKDYERLARNAQVAQALAASGAKLGPARDYARDVQVRAAAVDRLCGERVPVYQECGRFRLGGLLAGGTPATFNVAPAGQPSFLSAAVARAAGVEPSSSTAAREVSVAGRKRPARMTTVPAITFGKQTVRDWQVLVLRPEDEDQGSQLAADALAPWQLQLDEPGMSVRFLPSGK